MYINRLRVVWNCFDLTFSSRLTQHFATLQIALYKEGNRRKIYFYNFYCNILRLLILYVIFMFLIYRVLQKKRNIF